VERFDHQLVALAALLSVIASCEKSSRTKPRPKREPVTVEDAAPPGPTELYDGEPTVPPPPPTVKKSSKGDCKLAYAPRPKRDPNPMCLVKGGTFMMGSAKGVGEDNEHPQRKVTVSSFYMDQFEVTVAQVAHFLNASKKHNVCPKGDGGTCMSVVRYKVGELDPTLNDFILGPRREVLLVSPRRARYPATSASWYGARAYCRWAGKVLPTEAQWEYAARHDPKSGGDFRYPWGNRFVAKRAACHEDECRDGFPGYAPVGTFDGSNGFGDGSSPWGVHDMMGNAAEWLADCYGPRYPPCGPAGCKDPVVESASCEERSQRHGSNHDGYALGTMANRWFGAPWNQVTGFRCARPVPASP
jgi:formylglycine-generating enzyme required for sulfatase activity